MVRQASLVALLLACLGAAALGAVPSRVGSHTTHEVTVDTEDPSFSHTTAAGTDVLLLWAHLEGNETVAGVTFGAAAFTEHHAQGFDAGLSRTYLFFIKSPAIGTDTITIDTTSPVNPAAFLAVNYQDVDVSGAPVGDIDSVQNMSASTTVEFSAFSPWTSPDLSVWSVVWRSAGADPLSWSETCTEFVDDTTGDMAYGACENNSNPAQVANASAMGAAGGIGVVVFGLGSGGGLRGDALWEWKVGDLPATCDAVGFDGRIIAVNDATSKDDCSVGLSSFTAECHCQDGVWTPLKGLDHVVEDLTPQLGGQLDVNGQAIGDGARELLTFVEDPSAVNQLEVENQAAGNGPILRATGDDTDVDLHLDAKGTGNIKADDDLDVAGDIAPTGTVDGRDLATDGTKLDGIETAATADQTDPEIETAYNNQVAIVPQAEAEAGTATTRRGWTAQRVGQAITALGGGGGGAAETVTGQYDPDVQPAAAALDLTLTDEFTDGYEITWRWGNQQSATETARFDAVELAPADNDPLQTTVRWIDAPTAGTDFLWACKINGAIDRYDSQATPLFGFGLAALMSGTEATPTKISLLELFMGTPVDVLFRSGFRASYTAGFTTNESTTGTSTDLLFGDSGIYYILDWDATAESMAYWYSHNGVTWTSLGSETFAGLDPISVGRHGQYRDILPAPKVSADWCRTITDATHISDLQVGNLSILGAVAIPATALQEYDPDAPPDAADLFAAGTDEFTGGYEQTWRWGNQNTSTEVARLDGAELIPSEEDPWQISFRWIDAPSAGTDFMFACKINSAPEHTDAQALPRMSWGIGALMSGSEATPTSLALMEFLYDSDNDGSFRSINRTNYTSGGALIKGGKADSTELTYDGSGAYFLLSWDGTTEVLSYYYSLNGISWSPMGTNTFAGLDPISMGRFGQVRDVDPEPRLSADWCRTITEATRITDLEVGNPAVIAVASPVVIGEYDPNQKPDAADLFAAGSDEFINGEELTWRWGNQNSATLTAEKDGVTLVTIDDDSLEYSVRWVDAPTAGTDFMIAARISAAGGRTDAEATAVLGIGLTFLMSGTEATPTLMEFISVQAEASWAAARVYGLQQTDYDTGVVVHDSVDLSTDAGELVNHPFYLALRWDATAETAHFYYSWDGKVFTEVASEVDAGLDPISIGFASQHKNFLPVPQVHVDWFRTITDSTMISNLSVGQDALTGGLIVEELDGSPNVVTGVLQFDQNDFILTPKANSTVLVEVAPTAGLPRLDEVLDPTGDSSFTTAVDSVTAFQLFDLDGGVPVFNVDTLNERVGIGTAAPVGKLTVDGGDSFILDGFGLVIGHNAQEDFGAIPEFQILGTEAPDSSFALGRWGPAVGGPTYRYLKSRGTNVGDQGIVLDGDELGRIRFQGDDSNDFNTNAAEISAEVDGTPGVNDLPGRLLFSTTSDGASSVTERMRLDSRGFLSLGVAIGDGTLHAHTATAGAVTASSVADEIVAENSGAGGMSILGPDASNLNLYFGTPSDSSGAIVRWNHLSDVMNVGTNNTGADLQLMAGAFSTKVTVKDTGLVGIGVNPTELLHLSGASGGGSGSADAVTIQIADESVGSAWDLTNAFAALDLYSADTSGGAGVRARIGAVMEAANGANTGLAFSTFISSTLTERARLTAAGNFGINRTDPDHLLEVGDLTGTGGIKVSLANARVVVNRGGTNRTGDVQFSVADVFKWAVGQPDSDLAGDGSEFYIGQSVGGAGADLWIETSGNVGINTTNPRERLMVNGGSDPSTTIPLIPLKVINTNSTTGSAVGISFFVDTSETARAGKGMLVYQKSAAGWNRGDFHFLQDAGADAGGPTMSESVLSILNNAGINFTGKMTGLGTQIGDFDAGVTVRSNASASNWARLDIANLNAAGNFILYQDQTGASYIRNDDTSAGIGFASAGTTRMFMLPTGAFGLGTTTPDRPLDIEGSGSIYSEIESTGSLDAAMEFTSAGTSVYVGRMPSSGGGTGTMDFYNGAVRMVIEPSGEIGAGTNAPQTAFHLQRNGTTTVPLQELENLGTGDTGTQWSIVGDAYALGIDNSASDLFTLSYSSTAGAAVLGTNNLLTVDSSGTLTALGSIVSINDSAPTTLVLNGVGDTTLFFLDTSVEKATIQWDDSASDFTIRTAGVDDVIEIDDVLRLLPRATAPACSVATDFGSMYHDSTGSDALCWCAPSGWVVVAGSACA